MIRIEALLARATRRLPVPIIAHIDPPCALVIS
jgi:hypothetical protein